VNDWRVIHGDCLDVLRTLDAGSVDAVVTDPPYGIGADEAASKNDGKWGWKFYGHTHWDRERPSLEIFREILRVSNKSLVWGGNYFADLLPPSMGWVAWDKGQREFSLADFELAWTTENKAARCVPYPRARAVADGRFHPTQKPLYVMQWCLDYLAIPVGSTVLDPFCGSGTTGVACMQTGRNFIGIEIDEKYCAIARRRISEAANHLFAGVENA
jgi:DNA modification methylase